jgi:PEGA domain-containing protein
VTQTKKLAVVATAALLAATAFWPAAAEAQGHRGPRGGRRTVIVRGYSGAYFGPFGAFYGWSPYYAFGYSPYAFAPYGYAPYGRRYDDSASARVQVKPKQAEVYVDGYLAGVADDFDGTFQRLHLRPGGHVITLYLDGHRSVTERMYFSSGRTQKIKLAMVPLAPGEPAQPRPVPPPRRAQRRRES